jgi:hypothetical protein
MGWGMCSLTGAKHMRGSWADLAMPRFRVWCGRRIRPVNYQPLDAFWTKRGYTKAEGLVASYPWKDIDQPNETAKQMQFWIKAL